MKKLQTFWLFLLLWISVILSGCEKTPSIDDTNNNLPDNKAVSIVSDYAKLVNVWKSQIKPEEFQWLNFMDYKNTGYNIKWYSVEASGIKPDDLPDSSKFFDGRHVEYVWDEIGWSMIEYMLDDIICYYYLLYDQEIPYELMSREWDFDDDEYKKARYEFSKTITYDTELICWFIPKWAPTSLTTYFDASWEEPFWSMSIRGSNIMRIEPEFAKDYYISTLEINGDNIHFDWYDIQWDIVKEDCIDGGKWDTHDYKITIFREWDMEYMWCADKIQTDFFVWEEWTLWNFVKKTNYQYKWTTKRENVFYSVQDMANNYMHITLYENTNQEYTPTQIIMENTDNGRKVLYEGDYDIDDDTCEELNQYNSYLMEMFFLKSCPRW